MFDQFKNRSKYLLFLILLIAAFLRFTQLGTNPPSLTWDEVAWGYNAYTIGIDGKDEFGRFLPYDYLESFGDFKPPMYAYLSVLPVKVFGLTEFGTRFASAFFGVLTVLLTYFLTKAIFAGSKISDFRFQKNHKTIQTSNHSESSYILHLTSYIPIIAAALLAISPWHIMLSRAAFEANVATFFLVLGVYMFLEGVHKKPWFLTVSALAFIASMYTFNTSRIVAPLLVVFLAIGFWKKLLVYKKQVIIAFVVGFIFLLPLIPFLFSDQAKLRFKEVNIFTDIGAIHLSNQQVNNDDNEWWSKIIHNRRFIYGMGYFSHYFDNLSFDFLFIKGDGNPKFSTQALGQMYLWELPFFISGILFLIRKREGHWWIVPLWLLLAIAPAATARETPHALRIETALPTFQILVAYGFIGILGLTRKIVWGLPAKKILIGLVLILGSLNLIYFLEDYYMHYPKQFSHEWQYGYKDAILYAASVEGQYSKIYLSDALGRPYAYTLFYKKYDQELFRKEANVKRDTFGFVNVLSFGKYYFDKSELIKSGIKDVLYIDETKDLPRNANLKKTFYLLDGKPVLTAYTLN